MAAAPDLKILGRYRIDRVLGKGAMGVVYEGFDPRLSRRVAIKTILKSHLEEDTAKDYSQRFVREAQAVARLNHPNIVQVHDFGEEGDIAYLVMEFIQGKELKTYFDAKERFEVKEAVRIMGELCDALEFAHSAGIIHRDVKPGNVMIDSHSRAKLTDFGVARVQDVTRSQATGTMVGTPAFMSPEQIAGGNVDRRTDVFSAGIILYQFLTGEMPFSGSGAWTIAKKIMQDEPPWPSSLNTSVTPLFDAVVNKALAKNQNDRFQSARDLAIALRRALDGKPEEDGSDKTIVGSITNEVAPSRPPLPKPPTPQAAMGGAAVSTHGSQEVELEFWRAIKDGNDPDDFELYVRQFPNGVYAALAKRKVAKLRGFDTATLPLTKDAQREIDEAELQARAETEEKTRREAEESERRARWEAEEKRRAKWEVEEKARREAEAKAKREAEERAKAEAEAKARREAEAKARRESEERAAREAERAKAEAEARARREAEAKARRESEERAAREAERAKAEAEAKARREAEHRAKAEAEAKPSASLRVEPPRPEPTRPASRNVAPLIAIGLGVVIAAGAGLYFAFSGTKSPPAESKAPSIEPSKAKAAEQEAAAKAAQEKAQHDKAEANRVAVEHAREKAEADKAAGEKVKAAEIAAAEKAAREKARAAEIAVAEKATAVRAADEKERQEWEAIKASANPRDFDKFLAARPTGKYSDQARASLAKLHDDDRRRQQAAIEEERKQMRAKMEEERKQNQAKIEEERRRLAQEQQRLQEAREREEKAAREKQSAEKRPPAFIAPTF